VIPPVPERSYLAVHPSVAVRPLAVAFRAVAHRLVAAHRLGVALPSAAALLLAAVHLLAGAHLLAAVLPLAAERRAAAVSVDLCESARLHRRRSLHQVVLA
jgi:hypothetical protein